jgi:hypothetical protein
MPRSYTNATVGHVCRPRKITPEVPRPACASRDGNGEGSRWSRDGRDVRAEVPLGFVQPLPLMRIRAIFRR